MRFWVLGNIGVDESMSAAHWPAPGQTIVVGAPRRDLGGKGSNQAILLKRAGCAVRLMAPIGRDENSEWVIGELQAEGLDPGDLIRMGHPTDRSLIFVAPDGENAIASVVDCARAIDAALAKQCVAAATPGDVLVLQGNLTFEATQAALAAARENGVASVFNPSPVQGEFAALWPLVDWLVLNESEARLLSGTDEAAGALRHFFEGGVRNIVLTRGGRGATAFDGETFVEIGSEPVEAIDTTGAGDTFAAVLVASLFDRGLGVEAALVAASKAAAVTVSRPGVRDAFPTVAELAAILPARR